MTIKGRFGFLALLLVVVGCSDNPQLRADAGTPSASGGSNGPDGGGGLAGVFGADAGQGGGTAGSGGGADGSGGAVGIGETTRTDGGEPDAGADASTDAGALEAAAPSRSFTCTLILGAFQTSQWYDAGFESAVGTERWEIKSAHNLWTERWADPNDAAWNLPTVSSCATGATTPDRVLFIVYKNMFGPPIPPAVWEPEIAMDVQNIAAKYPSAQQIELLTLARAPNNQPCPGNTSRNIVIAPEIDAAIESVAARSGGKVKVGPKYYVPDCALFEMNITTLVAGGGARVAPQLIEHYKARP